MARDTTSPRDRLAPLLRSGLCVIVDPALCHGRDPLAIARAALDGGAGMLQLRAKATLSDRAHLALAEEMRRLAHAAGALFIVNDRADVARAARADGVHVGQDDLPVPAARRVVGRRALVGCSTHDVDEALAAQAAGADYLGVGAMFPSGSKLDTRPSGPATLARVRAAVALPLVAIGGITAANVGAVVAAGADAVAVIGAVVGADDPTAAARELCRAIVAARAAVGRQAGPAGRAMY